MKKLKLITVLLLVCTIVFSFSVSALEVDDQSAVKAGVEIRRQNVFSQQMAIMEDNHWQLHQEEGPCP